MHVYEVRPRKDHRGIDLISDVLPFSWLWYGEPNAMSNAIGYAKHRSRSHDAVIRVYEAARWSVLPVARGEGGGNGCLALGSGCAAGQRSRYHRARRA
jgi:hypothetical protein